MADLSNEELILKVKYKLKTNQPHWSFNIGKRKIIIGSFKDVGKGIKITWRF